MRKIGKWMIGILISFVILAAGFFFCLWLIRPSSFQIQEQRRQLKGEIQEIEITLQEISNTWEEAKRRNEPLEIKDQLITSINTDKKIYQENKALSEEKNDKEQKLVKLTEAISKWNFDKSNEYNNTKEENKRWWQQQKKWKSMVEPFLHDKEIHRLIDQFMKTFYYHYLRENFIVEEDLQKSSLKFGNFLDLENYGERGHCQTNWIQQTSQGIKNNEIKMIINLDKRYLLNKFGMTKYITSFNENVEPGQAYVHFLPIDFSDFMKTIIHELAHAIQSKKRSLWSSLDDELTQCESSGERKIIVDSEGHKKSVLKYPQLAAEHTEISEKLERMVKKSDEYKKFQQWWQTFPKLIS